MYFGTCARCYNNRSTWSAGRYHEASEEAAWPSSSLGIHARSWRGPGWWDTCPHHSTPPSPPGPHGYSEPCRTKGWGEEGEDGKEMWFQINDLWSHLTCLLLSSQMLYNSRLMTIGAMNKCLNMNRCMMYVCFHMYKSSFASVLLNRHCFIIAASSQHFSFELWKCSPIHNPIRVHPQVG